MVRAAAVVLLTVLCLGGGSCRWADFSTAEQDTGGWPPPERPVAVNLYNCPLAVDQDHEKTISGTGGYLTVGRHLLNLPAGTIRGEARLQMREHAVDYIVVSFRPEGRTFSTPGWLTLSTGRCAAQESRAPAGVIRYSRETGWQPVPAESVLRGEELVRGEYQVSVQMDGFSSYALLAP